MRMMATLLSGKRIERMIMRMVGPLLMMRMMMGTLDLGVRYNDVRYDNGNLVVRYEDFSAGVKLAWARKLASKIHGVLQDLDPSFLEKQVQMLELLEAADLGE